MTANPAYDPDPDDPIEILHLLPEEYHAQLEAPAPSEGTQLRNAAVDGMRSAAENTLEIALFLLRYGPALLIWFAVLGSIAIGIWRLRLRFG